MSCKDESIAVKQAQDKFHDKMVERDAAQSAVDQAVLALDAAQSDLESAGQDLTLANESYIKCIIG